MPFFMPTFWKHIYRLCIAALVIEVVLFGYVFFAHANNLKVAFLDVGQGDAILASTPFGQRILIDGGPDNSLLARVGSALPLYERTIDLVILTHPQVDHFRGFTELMRRYRVSSVIITGAVNDTAAYREFIETALEKRVEFIKADRPAKISLGKNMWLALLYPKEDISIAKVKDLNETSIFAKLTYGDIDFLFTGDAPARTEELLLADDISAEVLKVSHHGSKFSSSQKFLQSVSPQYAVIQSGANNRFGHPSPQTLERLKAVHAEVLRNDERGDVVMLSNGHEVWVKK